MIDCQNDEGRMLVNVNTFEHIYSFHVLERLALCGVMFDVESVVGIVCKGIKRMLKSGIMMVG